MGRELAPKSLAPDVFALPEGKQIRSLIARLGYPSVWPRSPSVRCSRWPGTGRGFWALGKGFWAQSPFYFEATLRWAAQTASPW